MVDSVAPFSNGHVWGFVLLLKSFPNVTAAHRGGCPVINAETNLGQKSFDAIVTIGGQTEVELTAAWSAFEEENRRNGVPVRYEPCGIRPNGEQYIIDWIR